MRPTKIEQPPARRRAKQCEGVTQPQERKPMADVSTMRETEPSELRKQLGDGSFGGLYERPDEDVLRVWQAGVEEVRELIANGWAGA